jgi:hypothetical protein
MYPIPKTNVAYVDHEFTIFWSLTTIWEKNYHQYAGKYLVNKIVVPFK